MQMQQDDLAYPPESERYTPDRQRLTGNMLSQAPALLCRSPVGNRQSGNRSLYEASALSIRLNSLFFFARPGEMHELNAFCGVISNE
jgi:hypothetical protein